MNANYFPGLDPAAMTPTRLAVHGYARVLGDCLKRCRSKRKHWWHASLRPSLGGLSTGIVQSACDFELELNLRESLIRGCTDGGASFSEKLEGQSATELAAVVAAFLLANGVDETLLPRAESQPDADAAHPGYSAEQAAIMGRVLSGVAAAMVSLRSGIREECSPIQVWPHHFDLSMLWLPGDKVPGEDPEDEESADKQMNFGFAFGDESIPEPYFYVTAYPEPEELSRITLPAGSTWHTQSFSGALLSYESLVNTGEPMAYLLALWNGLLTAGREQMKA
jgi:hypothetical protein